MNKSQLIKSLSVSMDITQDKATDIINAITESIQSSLKRGESVELIGFGTFFIRKRGARKAHNPKTLQSVNVPEKRLIKFKTGLYLHNAINKKSTEKRNRKKKS